MEEAKNDNAGNVGRRSPRRRKGMREGASDAGAAGGIILLYQGGESGSQASQAPHQAGRGYCVVLLQSGEAQLAIQSLPV